MPLHITLISRSPSLCNAWRTSISKNLPSPSKTVELAILQSTLEDTNGKLTCDCLISPANSFGIMDGGYDLSLSTLLSPRNPRALTTHIQSHLESEWNGYVPPGSCAIVPLSPQFSSNQWNASSLAVLPTMPVPRKVDWNKDLVYNTTWALLVSINRWNTTHSNRIEKILLPGLGTGTGGISAERCAEQMILGIKHFFQASSPYPGWDNAKERVREVEETFDL